MAFEIADPADIWAYVPRMGKAPELLEAKGPAYVVIYDGPVRAPLVGQAGIHEETLQGVMCLVDGDGVPTLYTDIDFAGLTVPEG